MAFQRASTWWARVAVAPIDTRIGPDVTAYYGTLCPLVLALVAGALRLGFVASFISEPVLKGFIIGLALTIMIGQVPKLLGIDRGEGNFFEQAWDLGAGIDVYPSVQAAVDALSSGPGALGDGPHGTPTG